MNASQPRDGVSEAYAVLASAPDMKVINPGGGDLAWSRRFKVCVKKMKSGDAAQIAAVLRDLSFRQRTQKLSKGEVRLLTVARQQLIEILAAQAELEESDVVALVDSALARPD